MVFFLIFKNNFYFAFFVVICDQVHDVQTLFVLCELLAGSGNRL